MDKMEQRLAAFRARKKAEAASKIDNNKPPESAETQPVPECTTNEKSANKETAPTSCSVPTATTTRHPHVSGKSSVWSVVHACTANQNTFDLLVNR